MGLISNLIDGIFGEVGQNPTPMSCESIDNPSVPFKQPVFNGLPFGSELVIHGTALNGEQKGFSVNYLGAGDDVALHINPRFKFLDHNIVLNTFQWGKWQREERQGNKINQNDQFRMRIVNRQHDFMIEVNDRHVGYFKHRTDPRQISAVEIKGDLQLIGVRFYNFQGHVNVNNMGGGAGFSGPSVTPMPTHPTPPTPHQNHWNNPPPGAYAPAPNNTGYPPSNPTPGFYQPQPPYASSTTPYPNSGTATGPSIGGGGSFYPSLLPEHSSGVGFGGDGGGPPPPGAPYIPNSGSAGGGSVSGPSVNCVECNGMGRPYGCPYCHRFN